MNRMRRILGSHAAWLLVSAGLIVLACALTWPRHFGMKHSARLTEITHVSGYMYRAPLPAGIHAPDKRRFLPTDMPELTKNGEALKHPQEFQDQIELYGRGRFRVTGRDVLLSSSSPAGTPGEVWVVTTSAFRVPEWELLFLWVVAVAMSAVSVYRLMASGVLSATLSRLFHGHVRHASAALWLSLTDLGNRQDLSPADTSPELAQRLQRFCHGLDPRAFFAGVALGLGLCVWLGHWSANLDLYKGRYRFLRLIAPMADVYPTPDHVYQFVRQAAPTNKILVLVSGNSTLAGLGQTDRNLWTRRLQEDLGDEFAVVNASFCAQDPTSIAFPLMERLSREYPHMYLVTDTEPTLSLEWLSPNASASAYPYDYFLWQSRVLNLLDANPERDAVFRAALLSGDRSFRRQSQEQLIRAILDRALRSADLWNLVGYRYLFTVFSDNSDISRISDGKVPFWLPRGEISDDYHPDNFAPPLSERFKDFTGAQRRTIFDVYVNRIRMENGRLHLESDQAVPAAQIIKSLVAEGQRKQVLFLVLSKASGFVNQLDPDQRMRYDLAISDWTSMLEGAGFEAMPLGLDYPVEDYVDSLHFSSAAGVQMGADVAAKLKDMATRDGWLPGAAH